MALKTNKGRLDTTLIHHSDRGVQYCCREYTGLLLKAKIAISMTQSGDPYENALAERVNRTIKEDMLQNRGFVTFELAQQAVKRAVENYNTLRPHSSCNYHTPDEAHKMAGELPKKWRKTKARVIEKMQPGDHIFATQNQP